MESLMIHADEQRRIARRMNAARQLQQLLGLGLEMSLFRRLYARDHLYQVLLTYGLILVLEESRSLLFGDDVHGVPTPNLFAFSVPLTETLSYPVYRLVMSGICLALAGAMYLVIQRTKLGMAIRAGSVNREMVQSLGIDVGWLFRLVFLSASPRLASSIRRMGPTVAGSISTLSSSMHTRGVTRHRVPRRSRCSMPWKHRPNR